MRCRHIYPHELGCELASIYQFPAACRRAAKLVANWLEARAVVVGWLTRGRTVARTRGRPRDALGLAQECAQPFARRWPMSDTLRQGKLLTRPSTAGTPGSRADPPASGPSMSRW